MAAAENNGSLWTGTVERAGAFQGRQRQPGVQLSLRHGAEQIKNLPVSYTHLDVYKRQAYNRVREGKKDKEILDLLRIMPQGKLDSWLTLSALKRSKALHRASPHKAVIFGGKHNLQLRSQGKITAQEWKAKRLLPLYFEGHAKSHGEQGGNHRFVLDIKNSTIWFYPRAKVALPLQIKLGKTVSYTHLQYTK